MLWRAPEVELFGLCAANGISQIVWSPLAQGVLTGKYRPGQAPPPDSRAANSDMNVAMNRLMDDAVLEAVDRLRPISDAAGLSMADLALAEEALGDTPVKEPTLAPLAQPGVTHRAAGTP
jgi:1-deoxyxylulose-5-phosphate synthase